MGFAVLQQQFEWPVRVYYEDTDAAGIVYHANYLRYMERARTEWLRQLGFNQTKLAANEGVVFVITHSDVHYQRPARFDEELTVVNALKRLRHISLDFDQRINDANGLEICRAHNLVACVDSERLRPRRIPEHMMRVFQGAN